MAIKRGGETGLRIEDKILLGPPIVGSLPMLVQSFFSYMYRLVGGGGGNVWEIRYGRLLIYEISEMMKIKCATG